MDYLECGSTTSLIASPTKLKHNTDVTIKPAGQINQG